MLQIAEDVFLLDGIPRNMINVYLIGDVLLDSGTQFDRRRIMRQLAGRTVRAHALTHAHPDHQGASHAVCTVLGIPFWVGERDAEAAETGDLRRSMPPGFLGSMGRGPFVGPGHPVARRLKEGDEVGGFTVIDSPGHSPGHLAYWRARDRVLILGDVLFNRTPFASGKLNTPPDLFTVNPAQNRESARKLAALRPEIVCFGHGPVLHEGARFVDFVAGLPS